MPRSALLLFLACAANVGAQAPRQAPARPAVVMVSIDGLKPEYVLHADAHELRIPNLRAILARGAHATGVTGVVPTVTYPSHTTLVTGVAPARHGIFTNTTFDPFNKNQGGWYWYASDIRVPTLWDAVSAAGGTTGNVHWPVTVGARITWNLPQIWRTGEADDRKLVRALSTPGGNVVMVIVSDHGFAGTTRSLHLMQAFRLAGLVDFPAAGGDKPSAWRATLWPAGGAAAVVLRDTADVVMRDSVGRLLRRLAADSTNGIDRILNAAELRGRGGFPGAAFLVSLREGFTFGYDAHGPLVSDSPGGGMHGYLPDVAAMRASLFFAGSGVPSRRDIGLVDQRSIAPTIAGWLGVQLPNAQVAPLLPNTAQGTFH